MRIAVANAGLCASRGGSERAAVRLAVEMLNAGHDARLLTVQTNKAPSYSLDPRLPVHFFPPSLLNPEKADLSGGADLLRRQGVEIVVGMESDAKHVSWGRICQEAKIPYVCSERNSPLIIESEFWNPEGRAAFLSSCAAVHELLPAYTAFVPKDCRDKVFAIPNAAPADVPESPPERNGENPVLLFLGRFARQKRADLLLRAFALISADFPEWSLRLAGWGEEEERLKKLAQGLGLDDKAEIRRAGADVMREYLAADAYCLPSLHEGFPNTLLEAMGAGLTAVGAGDCLALRSIISHGENGFLAAEPTPKALAEALRPLLASQSLRKTMGAAAWRTCRENYSGAKILRQWEEALSGCLARFHQKG